LLHDSRRSDKRPPLLATTDCDSVIANGKQQKKGRNKGRNKETRKQRKGKERKGKRRGEL
jgi:hypothetical protein